MTATIATIAGLMVGVAFVAAGASKFASGPAWPSQAAGLGVRAPLAAVVPWGELAVGAALVAGVFDPWPALVALAALVAFTGLIAWHLGHGRRPACACFGAWSARPLGAGHLARNAALIVLAVAAL